ncbi:MAG: hypothetical protein ACTHXA_04680 [Gulosibacter sp.]|uniref:hypothetical protein n=1 Tax=Gulosibacter sp. TaxID=2817531 RepID=UPI003F8FDCB5
MSAQAMGQFPASYNSTEARTKWREIMDASEHGVPVTIRRQGSVSAVADAERLRRYFSRTCSPNAATYVEDDVYVLVLEGRGFIAEGKTLEEAIEDMVLQLREYQADWGTHYSSAPNHQLNWPIAMLAAVSTDAQLKDWLISGGE